MKRPLPDLATLKAGEKLALATALAAIETAAGSPDLVALLDEATARPKGHVIGLTGPPGVGKSTLTNVLISSWRRRGQTVGVIAVDPSSRRTGGALLGDRARLKVDPEDRGIFVRSMAARDRLGGLSDQAIAGVALMRAIFDRVLVETVGIGQSEADISFVADSVVLCVQPASGDSLQFMKAGIMEVPDIVVVTKADLGDQARRAKADAEGALGLATGDGRGWQAPVGLVSATTRAGIEALIADLDRHEGWLNQIGLASRRRRQEEWWVEQAVRAAWGARGWAAVAALPAEIRSAGPFARARAIHAQLAARLAQDRVLT